MYLIIKHLHIGTAYLSIIGFMARGLMMAFESPMRQHKFWRISPHINDSLLLGCALYMAFVTHQYPFQVGWLTAKLLALFLYIFLGFVALRFGQSKAQRITSFLLALVTFAYIFLVAKTRNPLLFF